MGIKGAHKGKSDKVVSHFYGIRPNLRCLITLLTTSDSHKRTLKVASDRLYLSQG